MQVVDYETVPAGEDDTAALWLASDGEAERVELSPDTELAYGLGNRHCAGVREGLKHRVCRDAESPYCEHHTSRWACARCQGDCDKPLSACEEEHAVYLAGFAPATVKVGVTRSWRLETRLREQGADRAAHLETVSDGRLARQRERELAAEFPDRVRIRTKRRGLHREMDEDRWTAALSAFDPIDEWRFDYGLELSQSPMAETLASGTVRGVKGRLLVVDRAGSSYAVDLRGLLGYELTDRDDRALQSSMAAFE